MKTKRFHVGVMWTIFITSVCWTAWKLTGEFNRQPADQNELVRKPRWPIQIRQPP